MHGSLHIDCPVRKPVHPAPQPRTPAPNSAPKRPGEGVLEATAHHPNASAGEVHRVLSMATLAKASTKSVGILTRNAESWLNLNLRTRPRIRKQLRIGLTESRYQSGMHGVGAHPSRGHLALMDRPCSDKDLAPLRQVMVCSLGPSGDAELATLLRYAAEGETGKT